MDLKTKNTTEETTQTGDVNNILKNLSIENRKVSDSDALVMAFCSISIPTLCLYS